MHNKVGSRNQEVLEPGTLMDHIYGSYMDHNMDHMDHIWIIYGLYMDTYGSYGEIRAHLNVETWTKPYHRIDLPLYIIKVK